MHITSDERFDLGRRDRVEDKEMAFAEIRLVGHVGWRVKAIDERSRAHFLPLLVRDERVDHAFVSRERRHC